MTNEEKARCGVNIDMEWDTEKYIGNATLFALRGIYFDLYLPDGSSKKISLGAGESIEIEYEILRRKL